MPDPITSPESSSADSTSPDSSSPDASATTDADLESVLAAAAGCAASVARTTPTARAGWLRAIADALEADRDALVALGRTETHLPEARLVGEVGRTTFQLRLTANALEEGSWLEVAIDHADADWPTGPRPDLRRMLRAVGPVLVVAASNFPFAFSVAGGDTATALGAGCPVILKAHPGHPELSRRTAALVVTALDKASAPAGTFALIEGESETQQALKDPRVKAGAFTGSVRGGRALFDIASSRPDPIPFYGELGSVNPAFVLPSAIEARRRDVLEGFVGSFTLGTGQFCTKPGLLFVPETDGLLEELTALVADVAPAPVLNDRIADGLSHRLVSMRDAWTVLHDSALQNGATQNGAPQNGSTQDAGDGVAATLFTTTLDTALGDLDALFEESFGPTAVVITYDDPARLVDLAARLPGQLTATVQSEDDDPTAPALLETLADHAGRILWNGWPTGVAVTWAMQHGGSWPSTTASVHTSVGPTALRRFVTPVAYQDVPAALLPGALRDDNPWGVWQRVEGELTRPVTDGAEGSA